MKELKFSLEAREMLALAFARQIFDQTGCYPQVIEQHIERLTTQILSDKKAEFFFNGLNKAAQNRQAAHKIIMEGDEVGLKLKRKPKEEA